MKKRYKDFVFKLNRKFTHKKIKNNQIQELLNNQEFMKKLLDFSQNDIDVLCTYLGYIMVYYTISNDPKLDYSIEEMLTKSGEINLSSFDEIKEKAFFTHSCNGNMIEKIRNNGLGSPLNTNDELYLALSRLEQKLNTTGTYTKQQSGRNDEVYFTSAGATSFGYACNFAPERLFLGILRQEPDSNIPVIVGETKKDYYKKVICERFGKNITDEIMADIETVIDGYFSDSNYIVSFQVNDVISSDGIYMEVVDENNRINLNDHIQSNCAYTSFFTSRIGSNSNNNNMDNLVMINTIIPPEKLKFLRVPDRYDLIQLIASNKGLQQGEILDYFTFDRAELEEKKNRPGKRKKVVKNQYPNNKTNIYQKFMNKIKRFLKRNNTKMLPEASDILNSQRDENSGRMDEFIESLKGSTRQLAENAQKENAIQPEKQLEENQGPSLDD